MDARNLHRPAVRVCRYRFPRKILSERLEPAVECTAACCPDGSGRDPPHQCPGIHYDISEESGVVVFTGGATFNTASEELCYLGSETTSTPVDLVEDFDCESYVETAPRTDDYPYLVINTRETKTWNLGTSITGGLSCPEQLVSSPLLLCIFSS